MKQRQRVRIAEGIYQDQYGCAAIVTVKPLPQREKRFPLETSLDLMQAWRSSTRSDMLEERDAAANAEGPAPERGTFAADLPRRLTQIEGRAAYKSDRSHLRAWLPHLGHLSRTTIRPSHVQKAIDAWQAEGMSARTLRHRRRVLREMWQKLDGAHARPPVAGVTVPTPPDSHPVAVPWETIQKVAASLKTGLVREQACGPTKKVVTLTRATSETGYARFMVRVTTGQRPGQIMAAQPADIDLTRRIWFVRPAKGGTAVPLPLDDQMVKAWQVFIAADAWGHGKAYDSRNFCKLLRRHGWPTDVSPYALRSTFAIDLLLGGVSLDDLQGFLGHKQIETTRKHYAPVLLARLRQAVGKRGLKLA